MECQTLPSTSSLSGANSAELAPRRKTTLPKAAVFILPKRTSSRYPSQDVFYSGSSSSVLPPVPAMPVSPPSSPLSDMDVNPDVDSDCTLPAELRGRVRLLPRLPLVEYEPSSEISQQLSHRNNIKNNNKVQLRRPRHATTGNSGLKQLMPQGARVAIGGSIHAAEAVLAMTTTAASNNIPAVRRGSPCPYDEFCSTHKPSLWRRFKSRVKAGLGPAPGPKPNLPVSKIIPNTS